MAKPLEEVLRLGEAAYAQGAFDDALRYADEALARTPGSIDGLDLRANALAELGQYEAADEAFARLVAQAPRDPFLLLAAADVKIRQPGDDRERITEGLELIERAWPWATKDQELILEAELLRGVAANQLGECEDALHSLERVLELDEENTEARLESGIAQFELGRFAEAKATFRRLLEDLPDEPWAHHYLGLVTEREGGDPAPHFARARELAPDEFPPAVRLDAAQFDLAVADAIAGLPPQAKPHLANVVIHVLPLPSEEDLSEGLSPTILGVFRGTPIDLRSAVEAADHLTARITLFQKNLERFASSREELLEEIRLTVLHEVGHLLGLDEDQLYQRGLD